MLARHVTEKALSLQVRVDEKVAGAADIRDESVPRAVRGGRGVGVGERVAAGREKDSAGSVSREECTRERGSEEGEGGRKDGCETAGRHRHRGVYRMRCSLLVNAVSSVMRPDAMPTSWGERAWQQQRGGERERGNAVIFMIKFENSCIQEMLRGQEMRGLLPAVESALDWSALRPRSPGMCAP